MAKPLGLVSFAAAFDPLRLRSTSSHACDLDSSAYRDTVGKADLIENRRGTDVFAGRVLAGGRPAKVAEKFLYTIIPPKAAGLLSSVALFSVIGIGFRELNHSRGPDSA